MKAICTIFIVGLLGALLEGCAMNIVTIEDANFLSVDNGVSQARTEVARD